MNDDDVGKALNPRIVSVKIRDRLLGDMPFNNSTVVASGFGLITHLIELVLKLVKVPTLPISRTRHEILVSRTHCFEHRAVSSSAPVEFHSAQSDDVAEWKPRDQFLIDLCPWRDGLF